MDGAPVLPLLLLGFGVGVVSGLYGVGGGFMLTPLLNLALGVPYAVAVGSGLCQMAGTATSAYLRHRELGQGEPRVAWLMLGGSILGFHFGGSLLHELAGMGSWTVNGHTVPAVKLVLQSAYVVVLLGTGCLFFSSPRHSESGPAGPDGSSSGSTAGILQRWHLPPLVNLPAVGMRGVSIPVLGYLGLATGLLSGLLGVGGGVLLMPALIYGLGFSMRAAAATSSLALLFTVVPATFDHALAGHVDLRLALTLLAGSTLGAQLGAAATTRLSSVGLRRGFGVLILATIAVLLLDLARAVG